MVLLNNSWDEILKEDFESASYRDLREFLKTEYFNHTVYPAMNDIYNALKLTPYEAVKVVILGQDPYHNPGQAHGLAFSVLDGTEPPPSLKNIYKELHDDLGCPIPDTGCLDKWARQGVLLLNTALSVRAGAANSHSGKGWETLTDSVIVKLSAQNKPLVFILWGGNARKKKAFIDAGRHLVLESAHPSPLSCAGFFGCRHFSKANAFLERNGQAPINWVL